AIGTAPNTHLLDPLAEATKACSQYVIPTADTEVKLSTFYTKAKDPALSNVTATSSGRALKSSPISANTTLDLAEGAGDSVVGRPGRRERDERRATQEQRKPSAGAAGVRAGQGRQLRRDDQPGDGRPRVGRLGDGRCRRQRRRTQPG